MTFKCPVPGGKTGGSSSTPPKPKELKPKDLEDIERFIDRVGVFPSLDEIDARVLSGRGF